MALLVHVLSVLCVAVLFDSGQGVPTKGCIFGGTVYENNDILSEGCNEIQCVEGTWEYKGISTATDCGTCSVTEDLHIQTFEKSVVAKMEPVDVAKYLLNIGGEYIIAQPGFSSPALFGVNANFENCDYFPNLNLTGICITSVTYSEPGIVVKLVLPPTFQPSSCVTADGTTLDDPSCEIKVLVNETSIGPVGWSVKPVFGGYGGPILVFKEPIIIPNFVNCIVIVGTKGVSVRVCIYPDSYPSLTVSAMPSLKADPSHLYGLCNIFTKTGGPAKNFWLKSGTMIPTEDCLIKEGNAWRICGVFSRSWRL